MKNLIKDKRREERCDSLRTCERELNLKKVTLFSNRDLADSWLYFFDKKSMWFHHC